MDFRFYPAEGALQTRTVCVPALRIKIDEPRANRSGPVRLFSLDFKEQLILSEAERAALMGP